MRLRFIRAAGCGVLLIVTLVALLGCEEEIAAVDAVEEGFTLYGVLRPSADSQFVRVFPITQRLVRDQLAGRQVQFTSTDLETGDVHAWQDTLISGPGGDDGLFYFAPFPVAYDATYRLEVKYADDPLHTTYVDVEVPPRSDLVRAEATGRRPVIVPVYLDPGIPRLLKPLVTFSVGYADGVSATGIPSMTWFDMAFEYEDLVIRSSEHWVVPVNLTNAYQEALAAAQRSGRYRPLFGVSLLEVKVELIAANEEWYPPGGTFDPEILVQPGIMTNVENGFGFVGAGYALETHWVPPDSVVDAAGFRPL